MALFGRDYDRDFGYYGANRGRGYDRGLRGGWTDSWGANRARSGYDRDMGYPGMTRYDRDSGGAGYDRSYKSRWQTDHGDPFGDRSAHTPMRVIRGEFHSRYDRNYMGGDRSAGYGRDYYEANPMGYEPQPRREGNWTRGFERNRGPRGRGYDSGWF